MQKELSEMSLHELWQLFPIFLTEHNEIWNQWYYDESCLLKEKLNNSEMRINHIGSTSVKDIWAKPIIDILVEIPNGNSMIDIKEILLNSGYLCMSEEKDRISFNKGYTKNGFAEKVYHLHLRYFGDNDELYFRDFLNDNPNVAKQYESLKLTLSKQYEHDRDGYTNAKGDFIKHYTAIAKTTYKNIYDRR